MPTRELSNVGAAEPWKIGKVLKPHCLSRLAEYPARYRGKGA